MKSRRHGGVSLDAVAFTRPDSECRTTLTCGRESRKRTGAQGIETGIYDLDRCQHLLDDTEVHDLLHNLNHKLCLVRRWQERTRTWSMEGLESCSMPMANCESFKRTGRSRMTMGWKDLVEACR